MAEWSDLTLSINRAQLAISALLLEQCMHGRQTTTLDPGLAACGQFIGPEASNVEQRGLHGTAAALRVLAVSSAPEAPELVRRLVHFCEYYFGVAPTTLPADPRILRERENVIKIGELLYALAFVPVAHADTAALVRHLANALQTSIKKGKGWGYFLDAPEPELLPTAYALRGLLQHRYDIPNAESYVVDTLRDRAEPQDPPTASDITSTIASAYCIIFCQGTKFKQHSAIASAFTSAWRKLEPLFTESIEQNLEYSDGTTTHYVRVPFQLYLLALASELSFVKFSGVRAQRHLRQVLTAVQDKHFRYPYSGRYLSSRTNSIAFDALGLIQQRIRWSLLMRAAAWFDAGRMLLGSRVVRIASAVIAGVLILVSAWQWYLQGQDIAQLAPDFLAALLIAVVSLAKR